MPTNTSTINAAMAGGLLIGLIGALIGLVIGIVIWWIIFSKAGYSGARSLLLLIPIVNLIILLIFVFGEWPVRRELMQLRQQVAMQPQFGAGSSNPNYPPQQPQYGAGPSNPNYPPQQPQYNQGPSNPNYPPQQYR